jgi:hypothetical protein
VGSLYSRNISILGDMGDIYNLNFKSYRDIIIFFVVGKKGGPGYNFVRFCEMKIR